MELRKLVKVVMIGCLINNLNAVSIQHLLTQNKIPDTKFGILNLSNMGIDDLSGLKALNLEGVHTLILRGNRIREIPSNAFNTKNTLRALDLAHNEIKYVDKDGFKGLDRLWILLLSGNKIAKIPSFAGMLRLKFMDVYGNPVSSGNIQALQKRMPKVHVYNFPIAKRFLQLAGVGIVGLGAIILAIVAAATRGGKEYDYTAELERIAEGHKTLQEMIDDAKRPEEVACDVWYSFKLYHPDADNTVIIKALEHFYEKFGRSPFAISVDELAAAKTKLLQDLENSLDHMKKQKISLMREFEQEKVFLQLELHSIQEESASLRQKIEALEGEGLQVINEEQRERKRTLEARKEELTKQIKLCRGS